MSRIYRLFLLILFSLAFTCAGHQSFAQSPDPKVEELKSIFEEFLNDKNLAASTLPEQSEDLAAPEFISDGEIIVEHVDNYYAVTLPDIKITYPSGAVMNIGIISINATQGKEDGQWKMAMALPTPIIMKDENQNPVMRLNIGNQQAIGLWSKDLEYFSKFDATYKDITLEIAQDSLSLSVPEIITHYDIAQDPESKRWSGPSNITINNMVLNLGDPKKEVKLGAFKMNANLDQYDPSLLKKYQEEIQNLSRNGFNAKEPKDLENLITMFSELFLKSFNGFDISYNISDLNTLTTNAETGEVLKSSINNAEAHIGLSGLLSEYTELALRFGFDSLTSDETQEALLPKNMNIDIALKNIPVPRIISLSKNTLITATNNPQMRPMAMLSLAMTMPALLSEAQSTVQIKNNYIQGDDYKILLDGQILADIEAISKATADVMVKIWGLDVLENKVNQAGQENKDSVASSTTLSMLQQNMSLIKSVAKQETQDDGSIANILHITLDKLGQLLINGKTYQEAAEMQEAQ